MGYDGGQEENATAGNVHRGEGSETEDRGRISGRGIPPASRTHHQHDVHQIPDEADYASGWVNDVVDDVAEALVAVVLAVVVNEARVVDRLRV